MRDNPACGLCFLAVHITRVKLLQAIFLYLYQSELPFVCPIVELAFKKGQHLLTSNNLVVEAIDCQVQGLVFCWEVYLRSTRLHKKGYRTEYQAKMSQYLVAQTETVPDASVHCSRKF